MVPLSKKGHKHATAVPRSSQLLAALTCLAGALTYVMLSNAWRFNVHLQQQQQQPYLLARDNNLPSVDHPAHRYLAQGPRPLPGLLEDDDTKFNTEIIWPFADTPTAVRL
eukprot:scaffold307_cov162-Amphora_coffeaeformis.AAC.12